jgi:small-conductance mechanosensitive channel
VQSLEPNGVTLKILGTVRAADQWAAAGDLRKRLLAAFRQNGIEIPRPQRVVLTRNENTDLGLAPDENDLADDSE